MSSVAGPSRRPGDSNSLVLVSTYGRGGAGARVRTLEWTDRMATGPEIFSYLGTNTNGLNTLVSHPLATARAERDIRALASRACERLLIHRQASPFGRGGLEGRLLSSAEWGVYDFDDGLPWDSVQSSVRRFVRSSSGKCRRSVESADLVIAGNAFLAEWAAQHSRNVTVIPSCVQPSSYTVKQDHELGEVPRLVWIGSPSGEPYLASIAAALMQLNRRTGARLTIIGGTARTLGELETMIDRVQWVQGRAEHQLADYDVGIGPLTDDLFSRAKCAYKLLQYGASGLPFVASPVGANETVSLSLGALLATSQSDWIEQLEGLLSRTAQQRAALGRIGRETVEREFAFSAWERRWFDALQLPVPNPASGPASGRA